MTDKQKKFVEEYAVSGNASDAARKAGYSEKTAPFIGAENLKKPQIKQAIEERLAEHAQACGISKKWVLTRLIENCDRAMRAEPVRDREGNPTGEYVYQGNVANKALELIGKELGMFVERKDLTSNGESLQPITVVEVVLPTEES